MENDPDIYFPFF